jgi:hypothetical protein
MQGEYRTKFILALLGHACLGLSSKKVRTAVRSK